jgi:hypothetical protein
VKGCVNRVSDFWLQLNKHGELGRDEKITMHLTFFEIYKKRSLYIISMQGVWHSPNVTHYTPRWGFLCYNPTASIKSTPLIRNPGTCWAVLCVWSQLGTFWLHQYICICIFAYTKEIDWNHIEGKVGNHMGHLI